MLKRGGRSEREEEGKGIRGSGRRGSRREGSRGSISIMRAKKVTVTFISFISLISFLLLSLTFSSAFFLHFASAQELGWCIKTKEGKTCQPNTLREQCKEGWSYQKPPECIEILCKLDDGNCQESVPYQACIEQGGSEGQIYECKIGCCGVAGKGLGLKTMQECKQEAEKAGAGLNFDFDENIQDESACDLKYSGSQRGCCFLGFGDCVYTTKAECSAPFYAGQFCSSIKECNLKAHFQQKCGILNGDKNKLCWFDNVGNQEDCIVDCGYPAYVCDVCNKESCKDEKNAKEVARFMHYCKSTKCDLSNAKESQELKWEGGSMKIKWKKPPKVLLSGESICYNFYTGQAMAGAETFDNGFPRRSTGLQNQILRCNLGNIEMDGLGPDRNKLCFEKTEAQAHTTYTEKNRVMNCIKCGKSKTKIDKYDEEMQKLQEELQEKLEKGEITPDEVNKRLEEKMEEMDLEWYDKMGMFFASVPDMLGDYYSIGEIGIPGFATIKAKIFYGLGGSQCTKDFCESGKFKNGESYCVWRSEISGGSGAARVFWSPIDAACVPRYPQGEDGCGSCGGAGDTYDKCEADEAWALGNCMFEPKGAGEKSLSGPLHTIEFFVPTKLNLMFWYTLIEALLTCSGFWPCMKVLWVERIYGELGKFTLIETAIEIGFSIIAKIYQESI
ncbi:MAG: hypothetical protein QXO56_00715 [Candidatus Pacearchaeota archaeon]